MTTCETTEKFPVVMLYDHLSSVNAAMSTFSHLTDELATEFEPELRVWRMDDAASPEFISEANADITAAELVILTVRGKQPWPDAFLHWKEGPRTGQHAAIASPQAIVALIETDADGLPVAGESGNVALRSVATQIHPEVFVHETEGPRGGPVVSTTENFAEVHSS
ncbi:MAG TPA: hypothetical protein VGM64_09225 [Lacunisphaera sp.]|jgi:hypothetical protein